MGTYAQYSEEFFTGKREHTLTTSVNKPSGCLVHVMSIASAHLRPDLHLPQLLGAHTAASPRWRESYATILCESRMHECWCKACSLFLPWFMEEALYWNSGLKDASSLACGGTTWLRRVEVIEEGCPGMSRQEWSWLVTEMLGLFLTVASLVCADWQSSCPKQGSESTLRWMEAPGGLQSVHQLDGRGGLKHQWTGAATGLWTYLQPWGNWTGLLHSHFCPARVYYAWKMCGCHVGKHAISQF